MEQFFKTASVIIMMSLLSSIARKYFGETYSVGWFSGIIFGVVIQAYSFYSNNNK